MRAENVRKLVAQVHASLQEVHGQLRAVHHVPARDSSTVVLAAPGLPALSELPQAISI